MAIGGNVVQILALCQKMELQLAAQAAEILALQKTVCSIQKDLESVQATGFTVDETPT